MNNVYHHSEVIHNFEAAKTIVPLVIQMVNPKSVLDVGCGLGTWLNVFQRNNVADYLGVDGDYVDRSLLKIPEDKFLPLDLRKPWSVDRKFDLVISLEVAEHLPESGSASFVKTLISHGDLILFSAAIPGQRGQNHINEQWLSYWKTIFETHNFSCYDVIRPIIWDNGNIEVWYRQNMVIFCRNGHVLEEKLKQSASKYTNIVHPELFSFYARQAERAEFYEEGRLGVQVALISLYKSIKRKLM